MPIDYGLPTSDSVFTVHHARTGFRQALLPCVGAALIIWAGETGPSIVGRALSLPPVVFVGLISYSLYLWHWPLIVFQSMGILYGNGRSRAVSSESRCSRVLIKPLARNTPLRSMSTAYGSRDTR